MNDVFFNGNGLPAGWGFNPRVHVTPTGQLRSRTTDERRREQTRARDARYGRSRQAKTLDWMRTADFTGMEPHEVYRAIKAHKNMTHPQARQCYMDAFGMDPYSFPDRHLMAPISTTEIATILASEPEVLKMAKGPLARLVKERFNVAGITASNAINKARQLIAGRMVA